MFGVFLWVVGAAGAASWQLSAMTPGGKTVFATTCASLSEERCRFVFVWKGRAVELLAQSDREATGGEVVLHVTEWPKAPIDHDSRVIAHQSAGRQPEGWVVELADLRVQLSEN